MSRLPVLPVQTHARLHPFERRRGEVAVLPGWAREKLEARLRPRAPATAEQAPLELGVPVVLDVVVQQEQVNRIQQDMNLGGGGGQQPRVVVDGSDAHQARGAQGLPAPPPIGEGEPHQEGCGAHGLVAVFVLGARHGSQGDRRRPPRRRACRRLQRRRDREAGVGDREAEGDQTEPDGEAAGPGGEHAGAVEPDGHAGGGAAAVPGRRLQHRRVGGRDPRRSPGRRRRRGGGALGRRAGGALASGGRRGGVGAAASERERDGSASGEKTGERRGPLVRWIEALFSQLGWSTPLIWPSKFLKLALKMKYRGPFLISPLELL
ncbi:hypothetical protein PVAP13_9NG835760 [Panicum virgatum]|uniref:Uncharacterized protein n=1 Tax=Panicum virgatum TaxID=38727 RepID=A0A8T0N4I1_PANVG|nr:hypothetical protein PVAP13_9NG835760 [Panicum virgatum]